MNLLFRYAAIARAGSIRGAAEQLNITQPALSRSLLLLEAHYGVKLVERHARGVRPTAFGERLLAMISRMEREWELAEVQVTTSDPSLETLLRISAGPLWTTSVLPVVVHELQRRYPNLVLEIEFHTGAHLIDELMQGRIDIALGGFPRLDQSRGPLIGHAFTKVRDRVIAREGHPIHACAPTDYEALHDYPWIIFSADTVYGAQTRHAIVERTGRAPRVTIQASSLLAITRLLQEGDHLCMLPTAAIESIHGPGLRPAPIDVGRVEADSGALYLRSIAGYRPLQTLLELCEGYFRARSTVGGTEPVARGA